MLPARMRLGGSGHLSGKSTSKSSGSSSSSSTASSSSDVVEDPAGVAHLLGDAAADSEGPDEGGGDPPLPPPPEPPPREAAAAGPGAGGGSLSVDSTVIWKTFRFTLIRDRGQPAGWEVTCSCVAHVEDARCVRSLRWRAAGGRDLAERKLKRWCRQAFAPECPTTLSRRLLPRDGPEALPSLAELDAWDPPAAHLAEVASLQERRRRAGAQLH